MKKDKTFMQMMIALISALMFPLIFIAVVGIVESEGDTSALWTGLVVFIGLWFGLCSIIVFPPTYKKPPKEGRQI